MLNIFVSGLTRTNSPVIVVSRDDGACDDGGCWADGSGLADGLWAFAMPMPASVMNAATATTPLRFFDIVELLSLEDDGLTHLVVDSHVQARVQRRCSAHLSVNGG